MWYGRAVGGHRWALWTGEFSLMVAIHLLMDVHDNGGDTDTALVTIPNLCQEQIFVKT